MDVTLEGILIADKTKQLLWEQSHPISFNVRTKQKMSLENFINVFDRKFRKLSDIATITEILRINKEVTENIRQEFQTLMDWHRGRAKTAEQILAAPVRQEAVGLELRYPPPEVSKIVNIYEEEPDEWEEEDDDEDSGETWVPSYPGRKDPRLF